MKVTSFEHYGKGEEYLNSAKECIDEEKLDQAAVFAAIANAHFTASLLR
jgi:hypothetical protein